MKKVLILTLWGLIIVFGSGCLVHHEFTVPPPAVKRDVPQLAEHQKFYISSISDSSLNHFYWSYRIYNDVNDIVNERDGVSDPLDLAEKYPWRFTDGRQGIPVSVYFRCNGTEKSKWGYPFTVLGGIFSFVTLGISPYWESAEGTYDLIVMLDDRTNSATQVIGVCRDIPVKSTTIYQLGLLMFAVPTYELWKDDESSGVFYSTLMDQERPGRSVFQTADLQPYLLKALENPDMEVINAYNKKRFPSGKVPVKDAGFTPEELRKRNEAIARDEKAGFKFSKSKRILLQAPKNFSGSYKVPYGIVSIRNNAFKNREVTEIELPSTVKFVGSSAFDGCSKLQKVTFSGGVKQLGSYCFSKCTSLKEIDLPESLEDLESRVFSGCTALSRIGLPAGLKTIGYGVFEDCRSLKQLEMPEKIESLGESIFTRSGLTSFKIPGNWKELPDGTFAHCTELKTITIPLNIREIDDIALFKVPQVKVADGHPVFEILEKGELFNREKKTLCYAPPSLSGDYRIPEQAESITRYAFSESRISSLTCDHTIYAGNGAFSDCRELQSITVNADINVADCGFYGCDSVKKVIIGKNVTRINNRFWNGLSGLREIHVPKDFDISPKAIPRGCRIIRY